VGGQFHEKIGSSRLGLEASTGVTLRLPQARVVALEARDVLIVVGAQVLVGKHLSAHEKRAV
jgi:hypothetical protein